MHRPKDAVLVAVEGQWLAPIPEIRLRRMEIVERVLGGRKAQMEQPASRIVDKDEQGAFCAAVLEPPMMRAVDLHEFAQAITPAGRLMELLLALPPRRPDPSFRHPLAQRLFADCNLMALD